MANTSGICSSFKREILCGLHALGTSVVRAGTGADSIKGALYFASASPAITAATTAYTATGENTASGTYVATGLAVTNANQPALTTTTAYWTPSASLAWTGVTFAAVDTLLLYNDTSAGKLAIAAFNFGSQSVTAGNFTLTMPTNDATTGLIRLA